MSESGDSFIKNWVSVERRIFELLSDVLGAWCLASIWIYYQLTRGLHRSLSFQLHPIFSRSLQFELIFLNYSASLAWVQYFVDLYWLQIMNKISKNISIISNKLIKLIPTNNSRIPPKLETKSNENILGCWEIDLNEKMSVSFYIQILIKKNKLTYCVFKTSIVNKKADLTGARFATYFNRIRSWITFQRTILRAHVS